MSVDEKIISVTCSKWEFDEAFDAIIILAYSQWRNRGTSVAEKKKTNVSPAYRGYQRRKIRSIDEKSQALLVRRVETSVAPPVSY